MDFVGWLLLGVGVFLVWCAYRDVSPIQEFMSVLGNGQRPTSGSL